MSTEKLTAKTKMKLLSEFPVMSESDSLKKTLDTMTQKRLGVACFVDKNGKLIGLLTDGDLRRLLLANQSPLPALLVNDAIEFGTRNPETAQADDQLIELAKKMNQKQLWDLPVVDQKGLLVGLLHRHDVS